MHRIDTPTAQKDKFGQGKNGFTNGDPTTGTPSTHLNSDIFDALQEEPCTVIEKSGIKLDKNRHDQLYEAIKKLASDAVDKAKAELIGSLRQKLTKNENGTDIPDKNQFVKNLGLTETVDCAKNALDKRTGGTVNGNIISQGGQIGLKGDNRKHFILANADGKVCAYIWKDKGGDGIHINNGIDGGGDYIFHKDGGFRAPSSVYAGAARMAADGNILGSKWGNQWLDVYLKKTFQPKKTGVVDIVETGSGTGYYWRKFSDGKIEIFGRLDSTYGAPLDVVFPKVFTEIPFLFVKENGDPKINGWVMRARNLSKTGFSVQWNLWSDSGRGRAMEVCYHAIGG
ncbi:hypothetical protein [Symbiopectobacterium sp. RP]|uniref:hypothetical protein n=1 Tax=Symbiopectobacterium sp. RP TaxID=3248553 RepID=UPI003D2C569C